MANIVVRQLSKRSAKRLSGNLPIVTIIAIAKLTAISVVTLIQ